MGSSEKKKKALNNGMTLLTLVVDRSGSMSDIKDDMEGGIKTLIKEQAKEDGACFVTLSQFDDEYEIVAAGVPVAEMLPYRLVPRGSTALLDAIGHTISMVHSSIESTDPEHRPANVIFAVITDGLENASQEWTRMQVMDSVKARIAEGWQFSFIGADQDAIKGGGDLGVRAEASLNWDKTKLGTDGALKSFSASVRRVRSGQMANLEYTEEERRAASGD